MASSISAKQKYTRLGDIAAYQNGFAFKPSDWCDRGLPIIRIQNLTDPSARFNHYAGLLDDRYLVSNGDLLVSWSASLGAFIWDGGPAALNQHIFKVEEDASKVDRRYLFFALREIMTEIREQTHGATMRHINKPEFEAFEIPLPPLPEQQRIARILKSRFAAVEGARRASEARLEAARALPASYLRQVFESEEAREWPEIELGDVLDKIETGKSFQTGERAPVGEELGVLRVSAVTWGSFRPNEAKVVTDYKPCEHHRVKKHDLLISRANTKELVGAAVLVDQDYPNRLLSDKTLRLVPDEEQALKSYLLLALSTTKARAHIEGHATGTSDSMRNISQDVVRSTPLRLPGMERQRSICTEFADRQSYAEQIMSIAQEECEAISLLPSAYLRQAFSGAL